MEKKESEEITTEGPSFFQIVKAPLTTDFLRIPPCFVKEHLEEDEESVVLKGDSGGGTWHVKLERNEDGLFLRQGWKDFHRDNSLKENEFLLFRYDGAMVFSVRIFKVTGLERDVQQPLIPPQTASASSSQG